jgi:hypothetical protein
MEPQRQQHQRQLRDNNTKPTQYTKTTHTNN